MKTAVRTKLMIIIIALLVLILAGVIFIISKVTAVEPDPHEGQVLVNDGFNDVWITPLEGVEPSVFVEEDFETDEQQKVSYIGDDFTVKRGIDVSEHQYDIDWKKVAASGVEFAFIRVGYRGTTKGGLFDDAYYKANLDGAIAAGLDVGVYMFSQATTVQEAIEEAEYVLERIEGYTLTLPVVFDWEKDEGYRTEDIGYENLTDFAVAFCGTVENAGYTPGIYFGKQLGYYSYDLTRLTDYMFWITDPGEYPDFYYSQNLWQYSFAETVPGIEYETDMNLLFTPIVTETDSKQAENDNGDK